MVTKTFLPYYICDSNDGSDSSNSSDSSDSSDIFDSSDSSDRSNKQTFFTKKSFSHKHIFYPQFFQKKFPNHYFYPKSFLPNNFFH